MKDREARAAQVLMVDQMKTMVEELKTLRLAFDALFDVVAEELGYEAAPTWILLQSWPSKLSPRRFKMTEPTAAKMVRVPKATK